MNDEWIVRRVLNKICVGGKINKAGKPITSLAKYTAVRQTIHITACMKVCGQTKRIVFFLPENIGRDQISHHFPTIKTNQ